MSWIYKSTKSIPWSHRRKVPQNLILQGGVVTIWDYPNVKERKAFWQRLLWWIAGTHPWNPCQRAQSLSEKIEIFVPITAKVIRFFVIGFLYLRQYFNYYRKRPIIIWQEIKLWVVHMNTLSVTSGIRIDATEWDNIWQIMLWISLRVCQSL